MPDERIQQVVMPKWGLSMSTGTVTGWIVAEGDEIDEGDDLAEIDTDKIAGTLESTHQGLLRRIVVPVGSAAPVGATIAVVAPPEVDDADIEEVAVEAEQRIAAGEVADEEGPLVEATQVAGRSITHARLGEGDETVVLVHGFGGDKNSWLFVQQPLAERYTVYALDLPGHGGSSKDVDDGGLDTLVASVLGFLDAVGIDSAHLVGHSLGGAVVTAAAASAPERVRSLTLLAPAGVGSGVDADYLRGFVDAGTRRELKPHVRKLFADEGLVTRSLVDELLKFKRIDGVAEGLRRLLDTLLDGDAQALDITGMLDKPSVPVAVLWGREDAVLPAANAAELPRGMSTRVVDGAGHMVHMEAPSSTREVIASVLG